MAPPALFTRPRACRLVGLVGLGLCQSVLAIALARTLGEVIAASTGDVTDPLPVGMRLLLLGGIATALLATGVAQRVLGEWFALSYTKELRLAVMEAALLSGERGSSLGVVMSRVVNDLTAVKSWLSNGLATLLTAGATTLGLLAFLLVDAPQMAIALAAPTLVWLASTVSICKPLARVIASTRRWRGRVASAAARAVVARPVVLGFGRLGSHLRKVARRADRMNGYLLQRAALSGLARGTALLVQPAAIAGLVVAMAAGAPFSPAELGVVVALAGFLAVQLGACARALEFRLSHQVAMARIGSTLQNAPKLEDGVRLTRDTKGHAVDACPGTLALDAVTAAPGETIVAAPTVTTAAAMEGLAGLAPLAPGTVQLGGVDAATIALKDRLRVVTLLAPRVSLLADTVADNARLGAPSATTQETVDGVLKTFGLDAVREDPVDPTRCDRRLAAAIRASRAVLRGAPVVLIDDPDIDADPCLRETLLSVLAACGRTVIIARAA
ncbi:MAG: ABC transporter transmembrane domain-containing protein [Pseudomonadota bacterium]